MGDRTAAEMGDALGLTRCSLPTMEADRSTTEASVVVAQSVYRHGKPGLDPPIAPLADGLSRCATCLRALARRDYKLAKPFADKALKLKPRHPMASVKARIFRDRLRRRGARRDRAAAPRRLDLLAELQLKAGKLDEDRAALRDRPEGRPPELEVGRGGYRVHLAERPQVRRRARHPRRKQRRRRRASARS